MQQLNLVETPTQYLVGVEHPCEFCNCLENIMKVTDNVEGFGPGLLADYPIQEVEANTPQLAGYRYAREHNVTHMLIIINLADNDEEWWMEGDQAHKIDRDVAPIWESEEKQCQPS